jgi:hypothetical protein
VDQALEKALGDQSLEVAHRAWQLQ